MAEETLSVLLEMGILRAVDKGTQEPEVPTPRMQSLPSRLGRYVSGHIPASSIAVGYDPTKGHGYLHLPPPADISPPIPDKDFLKAPHPPYRSAYSSVVKAFAHALRPFVTLDEDLSESGKAFSLGSPLQYGVPTSLDEKEFINEALYTMCDPIQTLKSPVFSAAGVSYFEWLRAYVRNVQDIETESTQKEYARRLAAYREAAQRAEDEFRKALAFFKEAAAADPKLSFIDWMDSRFGEAYRDACDEREARNVELRKAQGRGLSDVACAREVLDSARSRLEFKQGNNMPCAMRDIVPPDMAEDPDVGVTYMPLYYLEGYATASSTWIMRSEQLGTQSVAFSPLPPETMTWAQLGFPDIPDRVYSQSVPWLKEVMVILRFRGMGAFDVRRGLWDITGIRTLLPPLIPTAAKALQQPILKTAKALIAYGVEIVVQLPPEVAAVVQAKPGSKLMILPDILGELPATWNEDGTALVASLDAHNAYPVLLGVLSQKINVDE